MDVRIGLFTQGRFRGAVGIAVLGRFRLGDGVSTVGPRQGLVARRLELSNSMAISLLWWSSPHNSFFSSRESTEITLVTTSAGSTSHLRQIRPRSTPTNTTGIMWGSALTHLIQTWYDGSIGSWKRQRVFYRNKCSAVLWVVESCLRKLHFFKTRWHEESWLSDGWAHHHTLAPRHAAQKDATPSRH